MVVQQLDWLPSFFKASTRLSKRKRPSENQHASIPEQPKSQGRRRWFFSIEVCAS
jgi:hypothetical protein